MNETPIVECVNLCKAYGFPVLQNMNLCLPRGKIIGLLGPNGSGKTTLIKILAGLLKPTSGTVRINGYEPGIETKAIVSYLPERNSIGEWMTADGAIEYYTDFFKDFDPVRARQMLNELGVPFDRPIKTLSKGTKEKLQLVMVMSRRAQLYLLDEPIGGVDPASRDYILNTIIRNYDEEASVIISTHLISDVERVLDTFLFLKNGVVTRFGAADTVREHAGKTLDELFREDCRC